MKSPMRPFRTITLALGVAIQVASLSAATFGTVVAPPGGASYSDIVLDEARTRVYLLNTSVNRG